MPERPTTTPTAAAGGGLRAVPFTFLALLAAVAVVGAILGVVLAPSAADNTVHNAAQHDLGANVIHATLSARVGGRAVTGPQGERATIYPPTRTASPTSAASLVSTLGNLEVIGSWTKVGPYRYRYNGPTRDILGRSLPVGAHADLSFFVTVHDGYLTSLSINGRLSEGGERLGIEELILFTQIGNFNAPSQ